MTKEKPKCFGYRWTQDNPPPCEPTYVKQNGEVVTANNCPFYEECAKEENFLISH